MNINISSMILMKVMMAGDISHDGQNENLCHSDISLVSLRGVWEQGGVLLYPVVDQDVDQDKDQEWDQSEEDGHRCHYMSR